MTSKDDQECQIFIDNEYKVKRSDLVKAFRTWDTKNTGYIDIHEFQDKITDLL